MIVWLHVREGAGQRVRGPNFVVAFWHPFCFYPLSFPCLREQVVAMNRAERFECSIDYFYKKYCNWTG